MDGGPPRKSPSYPAGEPAAWAPRLGAVSRTAAPPTCGRGPPSPPHGPGRTSTADRAAVIPNRMARPSGRLPAASRASAGGLAYGSIPAVGDRRYCPHGDSAPANSPPACCFRSGSPARACAQTPRPSPALLPAASSKGPPRPGPRLPSPPLAPTPRLPGGVGPASPAAPASSGWPPNPGRGAPVPGGLPPSSASFFGSCPAPWPGRATGFSPRSASRPVCAGAALARLSHQTVE